MDNRNVMLEGKPDESSENCQNVQQVQVSSSLTHHDSAVFCDERNMEELLYLAIFEGKLQKVQELLKAGVKTNVINRNYNTTPLHYAIEMRQYDIVEELLFDDWGTDVNARNSNGDTPLHVAVLMAERDLILQLLEKKQATVDIENSAGKTPIELTEDLEFINVLEKYNKLSMNETLFAKIAVPADGSCLFWATALAYLFPMKYNNDVFQQRLEKLFGNISSAEVSQVTVLLQQYNPTANEVHVFNNKTMITLVTEKFRKRVVAAMSSHQKQFEESITTYDFLYSRQEDYITRGNFQNKFLHEFSHEIIQYNIDIVKLKPSVFNRTAVEIIDGELNKVPDQNHVREFIFKSYLECMSDPTAWGGNHELQAISEILHCSILVFSNYDKHIISHEGGNDQLQLFNNNEVHYEFGLVSGQALIEAVKSRKLYKAKMYLNLGIDDVNYQDHTGFTALHFAVYCENAEIIKLLLNHGAETGIKNYYGETPTDIAISFKNDTIVSVFQNYHPQLMFFPKKKHLEFSTDNSKTGTFNQKGHQDISSSTQKYSMVEPHIGSSLGQDYQIKLIMLFLLQGLSKTMDKKIDSFYLATDIAEAGWFDDIIFKYKCTDHCGKEKSKVIFLQAKCKKDTDEKITYAKLLSKSKGNFFNLKRYFESYKNIKQQFLKGDSAHCLFGSKFEHTDCDFVIYASASFAFEETGENAVCRHVDRNSILYLEEKPESNHYYQLIINEDNRKKIMDTLQESSDCLQLAKELVKSVLCDECPVVNLYCQAIYKKYQFALMKSVVSWETKQVGRFQNSFLNGDENLSSHVKVFRDTFFAEAVKLTKKTEDELKKELSNKCIKFHGDFQNYPQLEKKNLNIHLPSDFVSELEVEEYFSKLKLFFGQPDADELGEIIRQKIQLVYSVPQSDADVVYSDVRGKVQRWQKGESTFLTETNMFYQDSVKISFIFNVREPVATFTGRQEELVNLHRLVQSHPQQVVITGLGGIGKTELARYYICCFGKHYENVIWINAANRVTLVESFRELSKRKPRIRITDENGEDRDIKHIVKDVYDFFSNRKSLFVFDDCANYEEICEFLPPHCTKSNQKDLYVLLTSCYQGWGNEIHCLVLGEFSIAEAMKFVKHKLNLSLHDTSQDEEIKSFVMKLHCFPLAIAQATAYMEYERITGDFGFSDYLKQWEVNAEKLLDFEDYESSFQKSVFATWKNIISKINNDEQHGQTVLRILNTISYFTSKINIDHEIFLSLADGSEKQLKSAIGLLMMYSVLSHEQMGHMVTIHPLIQQLRRTELKTRRLEEKNLKTVLKSLRSHLDEKTASHAAAVWNYATMYKELIKEFGKLPSQIISTLLHSGQHKEACQFGMDSFEVLAKLLGPLHEDTLTTFTSIAKTLKAQGNYEDTRECLKKVKFILDLCHCENLIPEARGGVVTSAGQIMSSTDGVIGACQVMPKTSRDTIAAAEQIKYQISEIYRDILDQSVSIWECVRWDIQSSMTINTKILSSVGNYDNTLKTMQEAVDKRKQTWGIHHPGTFSSVTKLAETQFQRGNYHDALKTYKELLNERIHVLGPNHLDILKIKNGICETHLAQNSYRLALEICEEVLKEYENIMGPCHPDTLKTKILLAKILCSLGKFKVALDICNECVAEFIVILGPLHHDVLRTEHLIATIYCKQGNISKAMEVYQELFNKFGPVLGPDNPDILETKSGIAKVYFRQGDYEKALGTYCEVFDRQGALLGVEHLHTLHTLSNIHHVLLNSGKLLALYDFHIEYHDMCDISSFDECSRLLHYWISFSPDNLNLVRDFGTGATINLPDNFDWSCIGVASMIAKRPILNYLIKKTASFKVTDTNSLIFTSTLYKATQEGELDIVKTLLEDCTDFNASDRHNLTLAHTAVQNGHLDIVKYFILKGIDLNIPDRNGATLLQRAIYDGKLDIAKYLIENGADENVMNENGLTLLHWAAFHGRLTTVKCLVGNGADVNILNKDEMTPLHFAVSSGSAGVVKYLLNKGADVSVCNKNHLTPLLIAVLMDNVSIFSSLISDTDDLNAFDDIDDLTLLHRAASKGGLNVVKYLVEHGAYVDIQNKKGLTPLHLAAQEGKLSAIMYLINQKADCNIQDVNGSTPLHLAANAGKLEVVKHLVHKGANINAEMKDSGTVLHEAVRSGCLDTVRYLMKKGAYLMKTDVMGITPLEEAVDKCGNDDVIKFLIKAYGKNLSNLVQDSLKGSENEKSCDIHFPAPVYFAVMKGYLDIVEYLVNEDVTNVKYADKDDHSLLHLAAGKGYLDIIKFLLRKGADVNYRNVYKETPLYDAINHNYHKIVKHFAANGAELCCVNNRGESPLHRAVFAGCLEVVMFLIDSNVPFDVQDKDGNTPLHYAAKLGNLTFLEYLLAEGASIQTVNTYGKTALHLCIETEEENFSVVRFLLEKYSIHEFPVDDNGWTPLHSAAYFDHSNIVDFLLEKGADINVRNYNYEAALHLASSGSSIDAAKVLLKRQANVYARDYDDKTFLDVASPNIRKEIESLKDYVNIIERPWYRNEELLSLLNEPIVVSEVRSCFENEKIDVNACTVRNETFLHFASRNGNDELVKMVLEKGADIYATTDIAETALHLAARVGNTKVLQLLLDKGVNVNFKNDHGEIALHEAARIGNEESVKLLFEQYRCVISDKTAFGNTALHNAVASRQLKVVEFLLNEGFEINSKNVHGETPLFIAVKAGNEAMVTLLLKNNADIKVRDCYGNTCVHIASVKGKQKVLQLLLDVGAEVNSKNVLRKTPLHLACNDTVVELLIKCGAEINARTSKLPIHVFAEEGNAQSIRVLLEYAREHIWEQDVDGTQPIHLVAREGHLDLIKTLFEGVPLDAKDLNGVQPIHLAAREGHLNVVQYILEKTDVLGMIEAKDNSGYQPIHLAARGGHRHIVEFILERNSHLVNSQSACKVVPLHLAARNLHMYVISYLLKQTDCSVVAEDELKQNFLHHFAAGLYIKCKKHVAVVVEHVTILLVNSSKNCIINEDNKVMASTQALERQCNSLFTSIVGPKSMDRLEHVFKLTDIIHSDARGKIEQIPCFHNILTYYKNLQILTKEMLNLLKIINEPKSFGDVSTVQDNIETISKQIQDNIGKIEDDQSNYQGLEIILHFLKFLLLTLHTALLKFKCFTQATEITQQIHRKENLLADYAKILHDYSDFVHKVLNVKTEAFKHFSILHQHSVHLKRMKDISEKLNSLQHSGNSNEVFRERFYGDKIEYYMKEAKSEVMGIQDERTKIIQRLAVQRSLQILGDGQAIKSLELKLHVDSTKALTDLRNNYLSHLTKRSTLFARLMSEYKPEVFDVGCDLDLVLKVHNNESKVGTKLIAIQTLNENLKAFSKVDSELQDIISRLKTLYRECKGCEQFLLEENTGKVSELHGKRFELKSSLKEKFIGIVDANEMIDEYFRKVSIDDTSRWKLYLAVPILKRRLVILKDTVLKDSYIERTLREDLSFTVNQKPIDRIILCLRSNKQLQIAMEFLIFDIRSLLTDTLKESNIGFHKKLREKLNGIAGYPWLRNHLAHLSHGSTLCHELTDLSKVFASDSCMLIEKGELIISFIELSFKMHQNQGKFSADDNTKCLFNSILQSNSRVEFLQALKELIDIKALKSETEEFVGSFSDIDFKKMLIESKQTTEFLKLLQECTVDSRTGRLKSKIKLFFQYLNEEEFTNQLLRLFSDKEYLEIIQCIIGHKALAKAVAKYLNMEKLNFRKIVEMDIDKKFFSWLQDLIGENVEALKALQAKVRITLNILKKEKCSDCFYQYLRDFYKELEKLTKSEE